MGFIRTTAWVWAVMLVALAPFTLRAEQATPIKMAVLDLNRIYRDASAAKSIRAQVGTVAETYRSDTEKVEQQLRDAEKELARKRTILSPEAFVDERRKLEQQAQQYQSNVEERRRSLAQLQADGLQKMEVVLKKVLEELRKERNFTLVLRREQAAYVAPELDITDDVLRRLDQQLPTVQVSSPGK